jgi:hypothetical protein
MATRRVGLALLAVLALAIQASAGVYVPPQPSDISGTTPSGLAWSAVATGTALPIRTSGTNPLNLTPGAVAYFNTLTGQLQVDPKGLTLNAMIITYTTGTVNISGTTPGPFTYATGTGANSYSPLTGTARTFPAKDPLTAGLPPTTFAARVGTTIGSPLSASLSNTGDVGNIASTGPSGFWNLGWSFPLDLVNSGSVSAIVISNATTRVTVAGKEYTVAEAVERKRSIEFDKQLLEVMKSQHVSVQREYTDHTNTEQLRVERLISNELGKDSKTSVDTVKALSETFLAENKAEILDPLKLADRIRTMTTEIEDFETTVDWVLSETNGRTLITI